MEYGFKLNNKNAKVEYNLELDNCIIKGNTVQYTLKDNSIMVYNLDENGNAIDSTGKPIENIELTKTPLSVFEAIADFADKNEDGFDRKDLKKLDKYDLANVITSKLFKDGVYRLSHIEVTKKSIHIQMTDNQDNVRNLEIEFIPKTFGDFFKGLFKSNKMENNNESKVIASTSVGDLEEHPINIEEISDDSDSGIEEPTLSKRQLRRAARKAERENQIANSSSVNSTVTEETQSIDKESQSPKDTLAFLEALGGQETKGKKNPYKCMNKYGYVGKYQMGEQAMAAMGIYSKKNKNYNNDWSGVFKKNKYGITCLWDYRNSPEKQDLLQIDYKKKDWQHIKSKGLMKYVGKTINGVKITESGMLAGAHLVGAGGLSRYLKSNGTDDITDRTGTPVSKYIKQFAGYDVSDITS